jgi:hypothetical protein
MYQPGDDQVVIKSNGFDGMTYAKGTGGAGRGLSPSSGFEESNFGERNPTKSFAWGESE